MKAITFLTHGGPDVLQLSELPEPVPGPGEVLVRLRAAALNRVDLFVRQGWPGLKLDLPHIPGADGAGEIAALGQGVAALQPGDPVVINPSLGCGACEFCLAGQDNLCRDWHLLGETLRGTYTEYICLPARQVYRLPSGFDYHTAAASALVFQTAWHSLITRGGLRPGETVLVVGASGGVNTASIQVARFCGAKVIVVGSDEDKLALASALGADILINRAREEDWSKAVFLASGRRGVDVVVDNVGVTFPLSFRAARKGGRILTVGNTAGARFEIDNRFIFAKHLSIIGSSMGTLKDFSLVMELVAAGKLRPALDRAYPLAEARQAHERLESGRQMGKITLAI